MNYKQALIVIENCGLDETVTFSNTAVNSLKKLPPCLPDVAAVLMSQIPSAQPIRNGFLPVIVKD